MHINENKVCCKDQCIDVISMEAWILLSYLVRKKYPNNNNKSVFDDHLLAIKNIDFVGYISDFVIF